MPHTLDYASKTFEKDLVNALETNGVVVVVGIYKPDSPKLQFYQQKINEIIDLVRPDGLTPNGSMRMGGILKRYGAASAEQSFYARLAPPVKAIFQIVYGPNLMVGCDGLVALRSDAGRTFTNDKKSTPEKNKYFNWTGSSLQAHIDVHPSCDSSPGNKALKRLQEVNPRFPAAIQSQFVLRDIPAGGATFVAAPGYHRHSDPKFFNCEGQKDFCVCNDAGYREFDGKWVAFDNIPAGSLILWDSRLPHGNKQADPGVNCERLGIFISWQPRSLAQEDHQMLKKRKLNAIQNGGSTDHWAHYVPVGGRGHGGSHYSNGKQSSKVIHSRENPVKFEDPILEKEILDAL